MGVYRIQLAIRLAGGKAACAEKVVYFRPIRGITLPSVVSLSSGALVRRTPFNKRGSGDFHRQ